MRHPGHSNRVVLRQKVDRVWFIINVVRLVQRALDPLKDDLGQRFSFWALGDGFLHESNVRCPQ